MSIFEEYPPTILKNLLHRLLILSAYTGIIIVNVKNNLTFTIINDLKCLADTQIKDLLPAYRQIANDKIFWRLL